MQLPSDIKSTLQQLCQNEQFASNISFYTKVAIEHLLTPTLAQPTETQCPTPLLFAIAHYVSNSTPLEQLALQLPENVRQQFAKAARVLEKKVNNNLEENTTLNFLNDHIGHLNDVNWEMAIENGRQVWVVHLHITGQENPIVLKLNYEELSLFAFKINQIVGHVKSLDLSKIV